jgi:anaerobic selenocysteine-containing dehydrogenase
MDRRDFFRLVGTASGGVVTGACGKRSREILPLLVPEREIIPGEEQWRPAVCQECCAGCGVIVRLMEGERIVDTPQGRARERIAVVKKIEGNPLDPVSGGRLCARGQAAVQSLYHPDRLRQPMRRTGRRGEARFEPVSWQEALAGTAALLEKAAADPSRIMWLGPPVAGTRSITVAAFLAAWGAPPAGTIGVGDFTVERKAAELAFGWGGLPVYEIREADLVLSIGADLLGGWVSPVFYSRQFGHMRQGRTGRRGRLIHAESRFSLTAGAADEWLPLRPGGEQALALALGHVLAAEKLVPDEPATRKLRESFAAADFKAAAEFAGIPAPRVVQIARALAAAERALVLAGASIVQTNSLEAVVTANLLNWLLGAVGRAGGVLPPPEPPDPDLEQTRPRFDNFLSRLDAAQLVFLDGVNPAYAVPSGVPLLEKAPAVVSFTPFLDDSAAYADWILPDHAWLEREGVLIPPVSPIEAMNGSAALVQALHATRPLEQILVELARRLGKNIEADSAARAFERAFTARKPVGEWQTAADFRDFCLRQGGWWESAAVQVSAKAPPEPPPLVPAEFVGDPAEFPLHLLPYPSVQFGEGAGAHLPWLQELPDPVSSAMWSLPVEVDAGTARRLGLTTGDMVRVVSPQGAIEAPVYLNPAALPGVVAMACGQGHSHYTRYASGRGANPLALAAPAASRGCGVFAFGATRVRLEKTGRRGGLIQFSFMDREPEIRRS